MRFVGFGSNGASSMRGIHEGLSSKLCMLLIYYLSICIAHREALTTNEPSSHFPKLQYVNKFGNKVYSCLGKSTKRHGKLRDLMYKFQITKLVVLQILQITRLSIGKVMENMLS